MPKENPFFFRKYTNTNQTVPKSIVNQSISLPDDHIIVVVYIYTYICMFVYIGNFSLAYDLVDINRPVVLPWACLRIDVESLWRRNKKYTCYDYFL